MAEFDILKRRRPLLPKREGNTVSAKRVEFEKPIVRVNLDKIRFPKRCPVCGVRADSVTRITVIPGEKQYFRPLGDIHFLPSGRPFFERPDPERKKTLMVPVCQEHKYVAEEECRFRVLCIISDGILMAMTLFAIFNITNDITLSRLSGLWTYGVIGLFGLALGLTYVTFRPRAVEQAVRIVGFDNGFQYVWLELENEAYREAFLEENKMHAELVSWVVKV
ncbi:hypothetical protein EU546_00555 [Candidatus Thorarchaeota archaeon]|nr:MAG: hypothetical protein EU546_00555 [Candidatus Thorarchaeota archaeon]